MPPKGRIASARPPTQRSMAFKPPRFRYKRRFIEEVVAVGCRARSHDEREGCISLAVESGGCGDALVRTVGGDEIDDGRRVLEGAREVDPVVVRLQPFAARHGIEIAAHGVERGHAHVTATGNVEGCEIERQADEIVAERIRHELVDLVAALTRHAAMMSPAACSAVSVPPSVNSIGLRNASKSRMSSEVWPSMPRRSTVSFSIEWPKR